MSYDGDVDFSVGLEITNIDELVERIKDAVIFDEDDGTVQSKRQNPYYDHAYEKIMEVTQELSMVSLDLDKAIRKFDEFSYDIGDIFRRTVIENIDVFSEAITEKEGISDAFLMDELTKAQLNKQDVLKSIGGLRMGGIDRIDELVERMIDLEIKKPLTQQDIPSVDISLSEAYMQRLMEGYRTFSGEQGIEDIGEAQRYLTRDISEEQRNLFLSGGGEDIEKFLKATQALTLWSNSSQDILEKMSGIMETIIPKYVAEGGTAPQTVGDIENLISFAGTPEGQELFSEEDVSTMRQFSSGLEMASALETSATETPRGGVYFTTNIVQELVDNFMTAYEEQGHDRAAKDAIEDLLLQRDKWVSLINEAISTGEMGNILRAFQKLAREQRETNTRLEKLGL
jgi:hypothetical protein